MASTKKPIALKMAQLMSADGIWKRVMQYKGAKTKRAIRIANAIKKLPFIDYDKQTGNIDPEALAGAPKEIHLSLKPSDIAFLWEEIVKDIDRNPSVVDLDRTAGFAETLGYSKDKAFLDKMKEFEVSDDDEDDEDEEEGEKEEEAPADAEA
jgi:hypothetical protein